LQQPIVALVSVRIHSTTTEAIFSQLKLEAFVCRSMAYIGLPRHALTVG